MKHFIRNIRGATSIEYALIATLIAVVIVGSVTTVGTRTSALFTSVANGFTAR